ncbi:IclR family transcriptional regulator [Blastococcus haudaquaticus]|uniref:Transcriptional regulator, IclR family n=1 Tax=Blastococcus haudaquaticus TaxID=1938745 RepID=A0A286H5P6_9ACTN|nr:IclR family transcriptional regulator [Blastococcus haudaquaticus]SOE02604.1 transcriptional regulator, IclR family [Blastococcus haudaquaticus]
MVRTVTGESVLSRAVRIFDAFSVDDQALQVSEIARRTRLHIATASRLIGELVAHGLLERGPDREVRIGVRMWELASRASPTLSLRDAAMPFLEDLHAVIGHHVQLGVMDGDQVLFIERLSARDAVVNYSRIAGRLPAHISSSGHVLLAYGPRERLERVLAAPLDGYTAHTITSADDLRSALAKVRSQGFAMCPGHVHEDAAGIAVPVRNGLQEVVAALSVVVPNDDRLMAHAPLLMAAARGVTRALSAPHLVDGGPDHSQSMRGDWRLV